MVRSFKAEDTKLVGHYTADEVIIANMSEKEKRALLTIIYKYNKDKINEVAEKIVQELKNKGYKEDEIEMWLEAEVLFRENSFDYWIKINYKHQHAKDYTTLLRQYTSYTSIDFDKQRNELGWLVKRAVLRIEKYKKELEKAINEKFGKVKVGLSDRSVYVDFYVDNYFVTEVSTKYIDENYKLREINEVLNEIHKKAWRDTIEILKNLRNENKKLKEKIAEYEGNEEEEDDEEEEY